MPDVYYNVSYQTPGVAEATPRPCGNLIGCLPISPVPRVSEADGSLGLQPLGAFSE
jgi:hypothetical protein